MEVSAKESVALDFGIKGRLVAILPSVHLQASQLDWRYDSSHRGSCIRNIRERLS